MLGLVFVFGRTLYFFTYTQDPARRGPGFGLSFTPVVILLAGSLYATLRVQLGF